MLDADIQGGEYSLFTEETVEKLTKHVKRVHIGTHLRQADDSALEAIFRKHGWSVRWSFLRNKNGEATPYGPVSFGDGVLSFINSNPRHCISSY